MFATKIGENTNVFHGKFTLSYQTKQLHKQKVNLSHKQYLFSLPTSRNPVKQTKVFTASFFDFAWKETTQKTLSVAAAKTTVYVIGTTYFNKCFLFFVTLEDIIFHKILSLPS